MLAGWGRWVHRYRWSVIVLSGLLLAASVAGVVAGGDLSNKLPENVEAGEAQRVIREDLAGQGAEGSAFILLFGSRTLTVDDPGFSAAMEAALGPLRADARVGSVVGYGDAPPQAKPLMRSADGHWAMARVTLVEPFEEARADYADLRSLVRSDDLRVLATGDLPITAGFDDQLAEDLRRGELFSFPLTLGLLLLVFGTLVAAALPVGVGALSVLGGIAGVYALSRVTEVSTYAVNIVTLVGLGVAIDYSLFIVSRYREELGEGASVEGAIARTMETAGRAVLFSGLTVAIGLSGLLFFQQTFLASMGLAGAIVVMLAVVYALTFLPALLSVLGPRVDKGRLPFARRSPKRASGGMWHSLAMAVMRRPVSVLVPVLAVLIVAGVPFLHLQLANGDHNMLPKSSEPRQAIEVLEAEFPSEDLTPFPVVVQFPGDALTADRVGALHDLSRRLAALPGVARVESVVDVDPNMTRAQYVDLLTSPRDAWPKELQEAARASVGERVVVLRVMSPHAKESDEANALLDGLREDRAVGDGELIVGGQTAFDRDFIGFVLGRIPFAVAFIVAVTYVLLLVQVGSFLIPLKAILMNLVSISASFGALVWIYQDGHLASFLDFTPQPLDPSLPVILFCIVFGLSMDYEVLLLSRMREEWERTGDNEKAVAWGLERSGKLITGAAGIMVLVFGAFALSKVVIIQAIGLGLALAVAVDATLVRALVVPATMRLLGDLNWWGPKWLQRFASQAKH